MKKKILLAGAVLMMAAAAVTGYTAYSKTNVPELLSANIEALARGENGTCGYCYSGGPGATSCSIEGGIDIVGSGVTAGCSVSCSGSYYACCSLRCVCCR